MNNHGDLSFRETRVIAVDEISQEHVFPERLRLKLANAKGYKSPIDIGSIAYATRGEARSKEFDNAGTISVVESSLVESRRELVVKFLDSLIGLRDNSIVTQFRVLHVIVNWLNANGYVEIFADVSCASRAYADYTSYLNDSIRKGDFAPQHAAKCQNILQFIIGLQFSSVVDYVVRSAVPIARQRKAIKPPREADVHFFTDVSIAIARDYSKFILQQEPFPCVVQIRDYEVVKFPSNGGLSSPFRQGHDCYNVAERRVATVEEYMSKYAGRGQAIKLCEAERAIADAQASVELANSEPRNYVRLQMAAFAVKAYISLFMLMTAASPTELEQFSYEDALGIDKSVLKKELTAVKFRARGKMTGYVLGRKEGLTLLREYLKLRDWILNGEYVDKLFFKIKIARGAVCLSFSDLDAGAAATRFHSSISGVFVDSKHPKITYNKARKHKSSAHHAARYSLETVAQALNHSSGVNISSYLEATVEQQESEFGIYWDSVRRAAELVRERSATASDRLDSIAVGHCESFRFPVPVSDTEAPVIQPNCRNQYGCLYCTHYVCHADEEDIHKLLSLHYVINAVRNTAQDSSHAEALYRDLSIRIEFILEAMAIRSESVAQLVSVMRNKVFNLGVLTPFWERRLQRYEVMGVVF